MNPILKPNFKSKFSILVIGIGFLATMAYGWSVARRWCKLADLCDSPRVFMDARIDQNTREELDNELALIFPNNRCRLSPPPLSSAVFVLLGVNNIRNEIAISPQDGHVRADIYQDLGSGGWSKGYIVFSRTDDGLEITDSEFTHGD